MVPCALRAPAAGYPNRWASLHELARLGCLLAVAIGVAIQPASACSPLKELTLEEQFDKADDVALVRTLDAKLTNVTIEGDRQPRTYEMVEARYEVLEGFKGKHEPAVARALVYGPGNCMTALLVGSMYVVFLKNPHRVAGWPEGTFLLWNLEAPKVKSTLDALRRLSKEDKAAAQ